MKRKMSKLCFGLVASAVLLAVNPSAFAQDQGYLNCGSGGAVRDSHRGTLSELADKWYQGVGVSARVSGAN